MKLLGPIATPAAAGGAGVATATVDSSITVNGLLYAVYIEYTGAPATTDVTIKTKGTSPVAPSRNLFVATNINTSGIFYPRADSHNAGTGAALTKNETEQVINDIITLDVAQANAGAVVKVWLFLH